MERFGLFLGSNFSQRYLSHKQLLKKIGVREKNKFVHTRGDYSGSEYDLTFTIPHIEDSLETIHHPTQLRGIEVHFANRIETLIQKKKGSTPVVCADIGGMWGLSWARLALHFQKEIQEGNVAFIVTSLSELPKPKRRRNWFDESNYLKKNEVALLNFVTEHHLLHRITGTASQLKRRKITVNDQTLPLAGNIDILFETLSVTQWSKIPDLEILHLSKLLSPFGAYYLRESETKKFQQTWEDKKNNPHEIQIRRRAVIIAHQQLQNTYGLTKVTKEEKGIFHQEPLTYYVFRKRQAPKITIDR